MIVPFKSVNPASGELVRTFEEISDRDLELALGTAFVAAALRAAAAVAHGTHLIDGHG
jgi:hypothetical protein